MFQRCVSPPWYDLPGLSAADDVLFWQLLLIIVPDGSSHFVGASGPVYPQDIREVGERNFSFYQGCVRVCLNGQDLTPLITIIIPHRLGGPECLHPLLPTRLLISEFPLPLVEITSMHRREWDWGTVEFSPFTLRQTESLARLRESWNEARHLGDIIPRVVEEGGGGGMALSDVYTGVVPQTGESDDVHLWGLARTAASLNIKIRADWSEIKVIYLRYARLGRYLAVSHIPLLT
ncbi:hypothetical protein FIBSPDRAFT_903768 [Athelia psychrophila]|uniref:Uncharacterized protein n=1 Tax=Athelia psychrophila TaxID=1759441 RepID=A0A167VKB5_9AGAM|nr:hypothetical protein FIBSPDRAFT_903768 [Fibularhizoctonia sp. CBS 109695]